MNKSVKPNIMYRISSYIIAGVLGIGVLGVLFGFIDAKVILFCIMAIGIIVGIYAVYRLGKTPKNSDNYVKPENHEADSGKIYLRQEQLDLKKSRRKLADVNIYKKTIQDEKTIKVPTLREELVIEKKIPEDDSDKPFKSTETFRIPLREEHVDIKKHFVKLNKVNVFRKRYTVTEHIRETLKREKEHIKINKEE